MTLSSFSFATAGVVAAAGLIWALRAKELPIRTWRVCAPLVPTAVWGILNASLDGSAQWRVLSVVELLRYGGWLLLVPGMIRAAKRAWVIRLNLVLWLLAALSTLASPVLAVLMLAFSGLVSIEQALRNADVHDKRGIKLCVIGMGVIFAWDLFYFSEYTLLGDHDPEVWTLRGLINAGMVPVVLLGVTRLGPSAPVLFVSRQAAFFSTAFLAVGLYLIVTALLAQYLGSHVSSWGVWLRPLLLVGSGVVLAALLVSEAPWRRLKVFLAKHFYRNKYDYRIEWLSFVGTLDNLVESDARATSIRAIAQLIKSPGGILFQQIEESSSYDPVATWFAEPQAPRSYLPVEREHELVRFMADRGWVIDIEEYRRTPEIYQRIALPSFLLEPEAQWRIISPLFQRERLLGFVALRCPPGPFTMTFEDRDLLCTAGRHVATLLAQQAADQRLAEIRQFDAFNRFAAFVMHDLKNSVAQLQLLISNAARYKHNPEFIDDAFVTIENAAARISRLIAQLQSRDTSASRRLLDLGKVLDQAVQRCSAHLPVPSVDRSMEASWVEADPERLASAFEHVIRNAQEAAGATGRVNISVTKDAAHRAEVTIADTGHGMDAQFVRDRLFRPFDSTKGPAGMGIGAYQARAYVLELGGSVEVRSAPGSGTRFIIRIPLCPNNSNSAS